MATVVRCRCGHDLRLAREQVGRAVRCPACGRRLAPVPNPASTLPAGPPVPPKVTPPPLPTNAAVVKPAVAGTPPIVHPAETNRPPVGGELLPRPSHLPAPWYALAWAGVFAAAMILGWIIRNASLAVTSPPPLPIADGRAAPLPAPVAAEGRPQPPELPANKVPGDRLVRLVPLEEEAARPSRVSLTTQEIVTKCEGSVALIKGPLGSGSGFVVAPGLVATNAHVIDTEPARCIEIHFPSATPPNRGPFKARLRYQDTRRDLALLQAEIPLQPLSLCHSHVFHRGEEVTIIGSPGLGDKVVLNNAVSRGVLSTEVDLRGQRFLQLGAPVNSGNSGGPAFNSIGEVIGVVTLKAVGKDSIGFCIPARDLIVAMEKSAAMSSEQIVIAERTHDVESIVRRLRLARSNMDEAIRVYLEALKEQALIGGSLPLAILETKRSIGSKLVEMNDEVTGSIRSEVTELCSDPALPFQLRRDLELLWDAFVAFRRFAESPPEHPQSFLQRMHETQDRFDQQADRMSRTLGIDLRD